MRLNHIAVCCRSEENAERFYVRLLGLKKVKSAVLSEELAEKIFGSQQACPFFLYAGETLCVEVFIVPSFVRPSPPIPHICLEIKDRDAFLFRCDSEKLPVRRISRGEHLLTFVEDGDGNIFEIKPLPQ